MAAASTISYSISAKTITIFSSSLSYKSLLSRRATTGLRDECDSPPRLRGYASYVAAACHPLWSGSTAGTRPHSSWESHPGETPGIRAPGVRAARSHKPGDQDRVKNPCETLKEQTSVDPNRRAKAERLAFLSKRFPCGAAFFPSIPPLLQWKLAPFSFSSLVLLT